MSRPVVIVGAGQAGFQAAMSLRQEGFSDSITLIGDEPGLPYQRPPLSKGFLTGKQSIESTALRPAAFYEQQRVDLIAGQTVSALDVAGSHVTLASGTRIPFDSLILATGSRNRELTVPGAELDGVLYLRTAAEAIEIQQRIQTAREIVVIGGGFIGLELAAAAKGKSVHVLEAQPRLMQRIVSPSLSEFYLELHRSHGVRVSTSVAVSAIAGAGGRAAGVTLSDGSSLPADLVLVGIGVLPNDDLAAQAGLAISNGIAVDGHLRTTDDRIYAIGDCAEHPNPFAGGRTRIESVQNATDQAKSAAASIAGREPAPYSALPWFWTDQFDISLQMAGLSTGYDASVIRGEPDSRKFSVFYFREGRLVAVDSVNRPGDHVASRKILAGRIAITPEQAADVNFDLKSVTRPAA